VFSVRRLLSNQGAPDVADQAHDIAGAVPTPSTPPKASGTIGIPSPSTSSAASPEIFSLSGELFLHPLLTIGSEMKSLD
jgi:hypothetical protein